MKSENCKLQIDGRASGAFRRLLIFQAVSYFGAFAACEITRAIVWRSLDGLVMRAAMCCCLGALMLSITAGIGALIGHRKQGTGNRGEEAYSRSAPIEPPECAGLTVTARCAVCRKWTLSTVLDTYEDEFTEFFACQHCYALLANDGGRTRSLEDAESDYLRRRWPHTWDDLYWRRRIWCKRELRMPATDHGPRTTDQ